MTKERKSKKVPNLCPDRSSNLGDILSYFAGLNPAPMIALGESSVVGLNKPGQEVAKKVMQDRRRGKKIVRAHGRV